MEGESGRVTETPAAGPPAATASPDHRLDAAAVSRCHTDWSGELHAFLWGLLRDAELAAEALQTSFEKLLASGGQADPNRLKAWLFQVAYHEAMLLKRRQALHDRKLQELAKNHLNTGHQSLVTSIAIEKLVTEEEIDRLRELVGRLPADQQEVLRRRIHDEQTFAEIARETGTPLGTVLTRMRLALGKLKRALGEPT